MPARDSDDLLEGRLDEDERGLAEVIAPAGFEIRRPRKRPWQELELTSLPEPQLVVARATGELRGALVDLYEYEVAVSDSKPKTVVAVVLRHPAIAGQARVTKHAEMPWYAWILLSPVLAMILPIAIPILFFDWLKKRKPLAWKSRPIGSKPFDDVYKIEARTDEEAKAAMTPPLQSVLLSEVPNATVEVRPGILACTLPLARLDRGTAARAIELAEALLGTIAGAAAPAQTAYRVSMPVVGAEVAEAANVELEDEPDPIAKRN